MKKTRKQHFFIRLTDAAEEIYPKLPYEKPGPSGPGRIVEKDSGMHRRAEALRLKSAGAGTPGKCPSGAFSVKAGRQPKACTSPGPEAPGKPALGPVFSVGRAGRPRASK